LLRLQQIVIENSRFINLGFRQEGGFVGEHDRSTGEQIPEHISARWQDIESLAEGLLTTSNLLENSNFNPILAAAQIAFGFVFIHPFEDGNGRIHRYFDATLQSEFLFECVDYTINKIIPEEIAYLQNYDAMKFWLDDRFQMPDKTVALLIRFLEQNSAGTLAQALHFSFPP
jgi:fido (protein-threonine AMPylation protein)